MRINELYGIDRFRRLPKRDRRKSLVDALTGLGFKSVGSGTFGNVLMHPKLKYVVKIFSNDRCYLTFVKMSQAHQDNPHFPRFVGKLLHIAGDRTFGVRMEPLEMLHDHEVETLSGDYLSSPYGPNKAAITRLYGSAFLAALDLIRVIIKATRCSQDLYFGNDNIMRRGEVPVITDPLFK